MSFLISKAPFIRYRSTDSAHEIKLVGLNGATGLRFCSSSWHSCQLGSVFMGQEISLTLYSRVALWNKGDVVLENCEKLLCKTTRPLLAKALRWNEMAKYAKLWLHQGQVKGTLGKTQRSPDYSVFLSVLEVSRVTGGQGVQMLIFLNFALAW